MPEQNRAIGLAAAIGVIFIWSGFVVVSRAGVLTSLNPFDVTGLRYTVAGLATLPFAWKWWPRHLSVWQQAVVALTGPGVIYSLMMYTGLGQASAAYGGVFANGSLPLFTMLVVLAMTGAGPSRGQVIGIAVIIAGGVLVALRGLSLQGGDVALGIVLFLAASAVLSVYMTVLRHWQVGPKQALTLVNIPNAVVFLPLWAAVLPSGLAEASPGMIALQALYQGLGPGFLAVILFALAARHIGPTATAGFSAAVPATAAVLAVPVLGEALTPLEWAGVLTVSLGLLLMVRARG